MEGRHDVLPRTDRMGDLARLDASLAAATSRQAVLDVLHQHIPEILPGLRLTLNVQVEDPALVESHVLADPLAERTDDGPRHRPRTRPVAGSTLARTREIGEHRVDLATRDTPAGVGLADRGYREHAAFPVTFGPSTVASLGIAGGRPLDEDDLTTARVVAAVLSARSFRFGIPGGADTRSLGAQVVHLRQAAHTLERTDPLTGLPNRVAVFETIAQARRTAKEGVTSTFAFIDLDHYKIVNDAHGHALGDGALVAFAERLRGLARSGPITVGRVGGDEFTAVAHLPADELRVILEQLAAELLERPLRVGDIEIHAGFSAGVYPIDGHGQGIEEIVSRAEGAAYQAKRDGRGRVIVHRPGNPTDVASHLEMQAVDVMRSAVRQGRLRIVAQPIRSVREGVAPPMNGEALVRLMDAQGHTLLPDDFVALAEQYDVVTALDRAVVARVVEILGEVSTPCISCNVAPHSLLDPAFVDWAVGVIGRSGVGPRLVLELTERLPIGRVAAVRDAMLRLRETGVGLGLDDFGAGTTSYGNLRELPVDVLKIDGALVRSAPESEVDRAMIRGIVDIAGTLDVKVIAEGVETHEQLAIVTDLGVDAVQGYYFGTPQPWPAPSTVTPTGGPATGTKS